MLILRHTRIVEYKEKGRPDRRPRITSRGKRDTRGGGVSGGPDPVSLCATPSVASIGSNPDLGTG